MNAVELGKLLGEIQVIDNRRVDEATLLAWLPLVDDISYPVAVEAVRLHRRESSAWLTPAHVRENIERMRVAALGPQPDEYGNLIDPEPAALAAAQRAAGGHKAVTS